jgi:hypothetical protein
MPPHKADFETLEKTNKPSRENKKGQKKQVWREKSTKES